MSFCTVGSFRKRSILADAVFRISSMLRSGEQALGPAPKLEVTSSLTLNEEGVLEIASSLARGEEQVRETTSSLALESLRES